MSPTMMNVAMSDEPPDETNGKGLPVVGRSPTTQPMLRNAWNTSISVQLPATMAPKASAAALAMRMPAYSKTRNSAMTTSAPTMPSDSTTFDVTARMTSVVIIVSASSATPKPLEYITP